MLAKNQEKQRELQKEIDQIIYKDRTNRITVEQLNRMNYLKAVLKETLR